MKKVLKVLGVICLSTIILSGCGNTQKNSNQTDGTYLAYWNDEDGEPWKYEMIFKGSDVKYVVKNKLDFAESESVGKVDSEANKIIWDSGNTVTFNFSDDNTSLSVTVKGEDSVYHIEGSDAAKADAKKWGYK